MLKPALFVAAALSGLAFAVPAPAQTNDRTLIIYGQDKCPANTICVRAPETDRYRIPQSLRGTTLAPQDQPWAARGASISRAGAASGIGSCSAVGAGGSIGCTQKMLREAREERRQKAAQDAAEPLPR